MSTAFTMVQDGRDHSGREGRMRERSMLLLASLAADAMDELSGVSMVSVCS